MFKRGIQLLILFVTLIGALQAGCRASVEVDNPARGHRLSSSEHR